MMLGGVDDLAQHAHDAGKEATTVAGKLLQFVDHIWHELENGDPMTWIAFIAVFLMGTTFVCVWKFGRLPWVLPRR